MSAQTQSSPLVFITTGGTIEKIYNPRDGTLCFDTSGLDRWLKDCKMVQPFRTETLMLIDSLEMTEDQRAGICAHIAGLAEGRIVVLHGTDTMVQTAQMMMLHRKPHQAIVFTGAMLPACVEKTDAFFNLGFAAASAQLCAPGVYVAMGGKLFEADKVQKNKKAAIFEPAEKII